MSKKTKAMEINPIFKSHVENYSFIELLILNSLLAACTGVWAIMFYVIGKHETFFVTGLVFFVCTSLYFFIVTAAKLGFVKINEEKSENSNK